ncbi:MAG: YggS family pyridoxal phosphate-dependent enzyme [Candidatus Omnitrophica bacterium]|nr:YggS family pyridoxal phosphate-dependent enzyme [Candidatus Omnitrophota bacterium]
MIKDNIETVRRKIKEVCVRIGTDPEKITIVCVTKGRPVSQIQEAARLGFKDIGENRVQEALQKYEEIPGVKWHMIGHLQSNKVKEALKVFDLIHSVDSVSLAQEINKQALKINKIQDILLEVKTSPESAKFGFSPQDLTSACAEIKELENVKIKGLMTIAPVVENSQQARPFFSELKRLRDKLNPDWLLSMGMSDDFEVAIEEGANIIRLGRAISQDNV